MGDAMELLRSNLSRVRIPKPTNRVYKQECCISFDNPVRLAVDAILMANNTEEKEHVEAEVDDKKQVSAYAMNLLQIDNGVVIPSSGWECAECDETENLWLNLTDGMILCGRKNWDGSGGNNHSVEHYNESGYPLAVKLGTLTSNLESADVYSYAEDASVLDPLLEKHLAFFGIDCSSLEKPEVDTQLARVEKWCDSLNPLPILYSLTNLKGVNICESAIRAVVPFWDKEDHLFRFGDQELVLLPSEFDAFLKLDGPAEPVMPRGEVCIRHCVMEFLGIDYETAGVFWRPMGMLSLKDLWSLFSGKKRTSFPLQTRRRAATMCLLGHYVFRMEDCCAPADVTDIVSQLEQGKSLGSLIVAEIIESLDKWATAETRQSFFRGSIVLLQIWLFDHLKINANFPVNRLTLNTVCRMEMPMSLKQGWEAFYEGIWIGTQIRWVIPWWCVGSDVVQSEGYSGVILAGIRNYYVIYPCRGMRQFGKKQIVPDYEEPEFSRPVYDQSVVRQILKAWENGKRRIINQLPSDYEELSEECRNWVHQRHMRRITLHYDHGGVPPSGIGNEDSDLYVSLTPSPPPIPTPPASPPPPIPTPPTSPPPS